MGGSGIASPVPGRAGIMTLAACQALLRDSEIFVREEMSKFDASHDYMHVFRVKKNAVAIAQREGLEGDSMLVVQLAALMHDLRDHKYHKDASSDFARQFLATKGLKVELQDRVCFVIDNVSFSKEIAGKKEASKHGPENEQELACVQDADRLDAIGAVGVARCFTFGGAKLRPLYNAQLCDNELVEKMEKPGEAGARSLFWAQESEGSSIEHFYSKLLKLRAMMKTRSGAELAQQRHDFMEGFLNQFHAEVLEGESSRAGDKRKRDE